MKSEFDFIEKIRRRAKAKSVRTGIGDDCAVIPKDAKTDLVMTADLLVEDVDFRFSWTTPEFIGHKALAVSLSDAAAMGAKPVWAMLSIGVPEKIWKTNFVDEFYRGWFRLAKKFGVELIGGDVSRTPDKIVIDSIAAGEVKKNKAVLRSGAKAGDLIFVTGSLGGAAAGLKLLEAGDGFEKSSETFRRKLVSRQLKPNPQVEIGRILGERNLATAMIDLSDGLSTDLAHLCRASKIGAEIFAEKIPVDKNLQKFLTRKRAETKPQNKKTLISEELNFALNGGEDFELLFTVNPKKKFQLEKALQNFNFSLIGKATVNAEIIELISDNKAEILQ
ncbi:MAG TPA: thiamine-phosphate kinase, partial [Pyrinomonadaceae bacterium]|nr:thiamine-phosphate kinase [Pyrinomonadaceae bacterium]